ncbi:long-chain fatty acid--CoA ligase [Streptomyces sp. ICC4]|uniref:long-chain fatty acid--CoA ligase n=1 Tax=Streptomyces sp. ICC4 TaxID=2099584 RepID=UPI001EF814B6|nr:long-chain fatty acid--CoA ligase [Streptomyces sp. ICC4]
MTASPAKVPAEAPSEVPSPYGAKPWLARLSPAQRAPVTPPPSVLHAFRAAVGRAPERTALAYFDGRLRYAEADALSDSLAGHLAERGISRGDRVAVMLQNTPHFVLAVLAAWKAGAVVVPLNPMYKSGEAAHILRDSGAAALVCDARAWSAYLREAARGSGVRTVLTASDLDFQTRDDVRVLAPGRPEQAADAADLAAVARRGRPAPPDPCLTAADTALISYTSGTSGAPKGAMNPHGALTHNAVRQVTGHPLPEGAGYFALAPLFHITGMVCELAACFTNAGTLVLAHRFDAGVVLDAFLEHRPAYTVGPATAFMALAAHPEATADHFASFQVVSSGGAPLQDVYKGQGRGVLRGGNGRVGRRGHGGIHSARVEEERGESTQRLQGSPARGHRCANRPRTPPIGPGTSERPGRGLLDERAPFRAAKRLTAAAVGALRRRFGPGLSRTSPSLVHRRSRWPCAALPGR